MARRVLGGSRRRGRAATTVPAGGPLEPVPARPGQRAAPDARHRRQGRDRRRLRGPLLLGHRDLRRCRSSPTPQPGAGPQRCCASAGGCCPPRADRAARADPAGALFPWRTINGEEASAYYAAGTAQYHINAAIAYALERSTSTPPATSSSSSATASRCSSRRRGCGPTSASGARNGDAPTFHIHGVTGPGRVHDRRQRQPVHERDGPLQPAQAAARASSALAEDDPDALRRAGRRGSGSTDDEVDEWRRCADGDVHPLRRGARHPPAGRLLPRPRGVGPRATRRRTCGRCCCTTTRW